MNNKIIKALVLCILISLLTGCFPSGEPKRSSTPETSTANNTGTPDNSNGGGVSEPAAFAVPNDLEHVKLDIKPPENYPTELPVIRAKTATFDAEKVRSIFLDGKNIIEENGDRCYTDDGMSFIVRDHQIDYWAEHRYDNDDEKQLVYVIQSTAAYDADSYYMRYPNINSELEGFPRSEAKQRADELIEKLGIKYLGEPTIYAFTSEDVNVNLQGRIITGKDKPDSTVDVSLPKDAQFYLIKYLSAYNGIPIPGYIADSVFGNVYQTAPFVNIILTKDELVEFSCYRVFDELEVTDTIRVNCAPDTVLSKLYDHYSIRDEKMEYRLEYYGLDFVYVTYEENYNTGEFVYKPLWCATGHYVSLEDGKRRHDNKFIDPATGLVFDAGD